MQDLPPGWYPDPHDPRRRRFWDGHRFLKSSPPRTRATRLARSVGWARSHKRATALGVAALLVLFVAVGGNDPEPTEPEQDDAAARPVTSIGSEAPTSPTSPATAAPTQAAEPVEPVELEVSDQDRWSEAYDVRGGRIHRAMARRFPSLELPTDAADAAVATCQAMADMVSLQERMAGAVVLWSAGEPAATPRQVARILVLTFDTVCPELAPSHAEQVAEQRRVAQAEARAAAKRQAAQERAEERQRQREERRRAREEREEREREEASAPPVSVYYENCSDVEAAGAAPIYVGDPGYSRDLDRDGDGVACES